MHTDRYQQQRNLLRFMKRQMVQRKIVMTENMLMEGWRHEGVAQRLRNGTFDFIARRRNRSSSILLKKVAHGRLSATKDGAIQLTLKIFKKEGINFHDTFLKEATEAVSDI